MKSGRRKDGGIIEKFGAGGVLTSTKPDLEKN